MPGTTSRGYPYPLYTEANNFPAQSQALATALDTDLTTVYNAYNAAYNQPSVILRSSLVNQNVPANTDTTATFATEEYDNAGFFDGSVSQTTITFPQAAVYFATVRVTFTSNGNATVGGRQVHLATTGSLGVVGRRSISGNQNVATAVAFSCLFWTSAGSTATVVMRQNSGATVVSSTRTITITRMGQL